MDLRASLLEFARSLESESEAAADLWTWLPSYRVATAAHGEYATNYRPSTTEIVREATGVMTCLFGGHDNYPFSTCPCDKCELAVSPNEELFGFPAYLADFRGRKHGV